ncbi:MAG: hypothetical protein ABL866_04870 [Devosia sp.]
MKGGAFIVGPWDGAGAVLAGLAREVGLDPVHSYSSLARAEAQAIKTPLLFFLCAAVDDIRTLKPMADAIRFSPARRLRFSPLIYFTHNPALEDIKRCINMGFDDVIVLPQSGARVEERIGRLVGSVQVYFETPTYFGPDRRNRFEEVVAHPKRGSGGEFRRIEIIRRPDTGTEVLNGEEQVVL